MYHYERQIQKFLQLHSKTNYNKQIHFIMRAWSSLGNVYGYIGMIFLTSAYFANKSIENADFYGDYLNLTRPYVHKFVWGMNIAQALKAVFRMPRPNQKTQKYPKTGKNPELVQLISEKTKAEYGPPSTHVVGISLILYPHLVDHSWNLFYACLALSATSRIYLGAHTIFCITTGSLFSILVHYFHASISSFSNINTPIFNMIHLITLLVVVFNFPECSDDKVLADKTIRDQQRIGMASVALILIDLLKLEFLPTDFGMVLGYSAVMVGLVFLVTRMGFKHAENLMILVISMHLFYVEPMMIRKLF